jgi:predicted transcriptional regulator
MKKFMVADLVKDLRSDLINKAKERYNLNDSEAERFVDNFPNESTWADVEETAESLGLDITDVEDDDVENYMEMGGIAKGELESSVGPIQWLYDNKAKAYIVYMVLTLYDKPRDIIYNIEPSIMKEWTDSESMGEYWNNKIRSNQDIENAASSSDFPIGGCNDNLLDPSVVSRFNTRFVAIS